MKPEEFEKKMENLNTPKSESNPPVELKLAILNAKRSATVGIWFIIAPCIFLSFVLLKHYLKLNLGVLDQFGDLITYLDKNPATWWIQPVVLIGLPVTGVILNALAILHFAYNPTEKSILITLKLKWINLAILGICLGIVMIFMLYLIVENLQPSH